MSKRPPGSQDPKYLEPPPDGYPLHLPACIRWYPRLTWTDKELWDLIRNLDKGDRHCFASDERMADELETSVDYIRKSRRKLKKLGLIEEHSRSHKRDLRIPTGLEEQFRYVVVAHYNRVESRRRKRTP